MKKRDAFPYPSSQTQPKEKRQREEEGKKGALFPPLPHSAPATIPYSSLTKPKKKQEKKEKKQTRRSQHCFGTSPPPHSK